MFKDKAPPLDGLKTWRNIIKNTSNTLKKYDMSSKM